MPKTLEHSIANSADNPLCGIEQHENRPHHALSVPESQIQQDLPRLYCCDSRSDDCPLSKIYENKVYCVYIAAVK